jgi:hypothetical protein
MLMPAIASEAKWFTAFYVYVYKKNLIKFNARQKVGVQFTVLNYIFNLNYSHVH